MGERKVRVRPRSNAPFSLSQGNLAFVADADPLLVDSVNPFHFDV